MLHRIFALALVALFVATGCAQSSTATHRPLDHYYDRDDGFWLNSDYDVVHISNGSATGMEVEVSTGNISAPDIAATDDITVADDLTVTGASTLTGGVAVNGAASAMSFPDGDEQITVKDNDSTALIIGSTGRTNLLTVDSGNDTETVVITGTTTADAFHVDTGTSQFDENVDVTGGIDTDYITVTTPAFPLQMIRFCGNGPDGGTETFLSPVPFDDTEADFISGGAGCDGEDDTTITNADEPWPILAQSAFKPVAAICTAICTGASAANDAIVFQMYDDAGAISEATCTTSALGGDATAAQCTWTDTTPETVAASSELAIGVDNTDDDCNDAGDDFECVVYVTF